MIYPNWGNTVPVNVRYSFEGDKFEVFLDDKKIGGKLLDLFMEMNRVESQCNEKMSKARNAFWKEYSRNVRAKG